MLKGIFNTFGRIFNVVISKGRVLPHKRRLVGVTKSLTYSTNSNGTNDMVLYYNVMTLQVELDTIDTQPPWKNVTYVALM